jgi:hypothetical protein
VANSRNVGKCSDTVILIVEEQRLLLKNRDEFPTIGKSWPQVGGITVKGSITPSLWPPNFDSGAYLTKITNKGIRELIQLSPTSTCPEFA